MPFDDSLAGGIRDVLAHKLDIKEKKMFGGLGFLLNGNMLVGVWKDSLIVRLGEEQGEEALLEPHVKPFDITGKAMKGLIDLARKGHFKDETVVFLHTGGAQGLSGYATVLEGHLA